jgi:hypothetical protein
VLCRALHVHLSLCLGPLPLVHVSGTVDASDLVHVPVLFAADAMTGLPCVVVNVHEGTLGRLCDLHPTLKPMLKRLQHERLVTSGPVRIRRNGAQLDLRI